MPNHIPLSTAMVDNARNPRKPRRLVMPPLMTTLVAQAIALGYELPDTEDGDVTDQHGRVFPAMKVTLDGNQHLPAVEGVCRVVNGPEPLDERVGWAARSALAEALRLAMAEQTRRAAVEKAESQGERS